MAAWRGSEEGTTPLLRLLTGQGPFGGEGSGATGLAQGVVSGKTTGQMNGPLICSVTCTHPVPF